MNRLPRPTTGTASDRVSRCLDYAIGVVVEIALVCLIMLAAFAIAFAVVKLWP